MDNPRSTSAHNQDRYPFLSEHCLTPTFLSCHSIARLAMPAHHGQRQSTMAAYR